ncbi:hypothetical protein LINPERHAP1_LOCUS37802 [Linum perenne]
MESIKGVFTGKKKEEGENPMETAASFTLTRFADELKKSQKVGSFKQYIVGRSSEATFSDAFAKMEAVIRYLSTFDPAGEVWFTETSKLLIFREIRNPVVTLLSFSQITELRSVDFIDVLATTLWFPV